MIGAIETRYRGYRFRSRLEARWATFFDYLGCAWEYEKEGYVLPNGDRYLPDFWVSNVGLRSTLIEDSGIWVEIKPIEPSEPEMERCASLGELTQKGVVLFYGLPGERPDDWGYELWPTWDYPMTFCRCYECGRMKVEFPVGKYMYCESCGEWCDDEHTAIIAACAAARAARFEFLDRYSIGLRPSWRRDDSIRGDE